MVHLVRPYTCKSTDVITLVEKLSQQAPWGMRLTTATQEMLMLLCLVMNGGSKGGPRREGSDGRPLESAVAKEG